MRLYRKLPLIPPWICYLTLLLGSVFSVGAALYMQHAQGLQPCTLCIIQRYAFIVLGLIAALALILPLRPIRGALVGFGVIVSIGGMVAAGRNLWVLYHPDILCGRDPLELFLNNLPSAQSWPGVFGVRGLCSDPIPPLLGLPLPAWSLLALLLGALLLLLSLRKRRQFF